MCRTMFSMAGNGRVEACLEARRGIVRAALLASTALWMMGTLPAPAQDATWLASPGSGDFNTDAHWSTGTVPTGTASFGTSDTKNISFSRNTTVGGFTFNAGADAFIFSSNRFLFFNGAGIVINGGSATINNSSSQLMFENNSTAGSATINNDGNMFFGNSSTAGSATITNNKVLDFESSSSGGTARLINGATAIITLGLLDTAGITAGSIEGAGTINLDSKNLAVGGNNLSTTFSGVLQGTGGSLTKTGTGALTLSGANTYTGGTIITGGTLQLGNGGTTGSIVGDVTNNGTLAFNRSDTLTFGGLISGTGALQQNGPGTTILTANNTYTGATVVNGGTLQAGAANAFGASSAATVNAGGTLDLGGFAQSINAVSLSGGTLANGVLTGAVTSAGGTVTGIGGTASLTTTAGTTTLLGTTYTGATVVNGGTLQAGAGNAFSASSAVTVNAGGTLDLGGFAQSINAVSLSGGTLANGLLNGAVTSSGGTVNGIGGTGSLTTTAGTTTLLGTNTYTGGTTIAGGTLQLGNGGTSGSIVGDVTNNGTLAFNRSDTLTFGGLISGTGALQHNGPGTTILTANNTYTGATVINGGTLRAGAASSLGASSAATVNAGGTLDLGGFAQSINAVSLSGGTLANGVLTGAVTSAGGTVNGIGGTASLTTTADTTTLLGTNTYTGATVINGGTLQAGAANAFSTSSATTVNAGGTIDLGGFAQSISAVSLSGGTLANGVLTGAVTSAGGTVNGIGGTASLTTTAGTTTLLGTNTYTGSTTIAGGTLQLGNGGTSGSILGDVTNNGTLAFNRSDTLTFGGLISGTGALQHNGSGTTILTNANTHSGGTTLAAGTLRLENDQALGTGALTTTSSAVDYANGVTIANPVVVNGNTTQLQVTTGLATQSGVISELNGPRPIEKMGAGTLVLSADNTYTGGTTITGGTLQLGSGGTSGSIIGDVNNNGTLAFTRSDPFTFGGLVSGTGALQQNGPGATILTANSTYTGATTIDGGTLLVNGSIASSSGLTVHPGATVGGTGTLPTTTITGGTLSPGNSIGTITINGDYAPNAAATYLVEVSPTDADRTNVTGTAALRGTVQAAFQPGSYVARQHTILSAAGGRTGTFDALTTNDLYAGFNGNLSYTTTDVILKLIAMLGQHAGADLSSNALNIANAINNFFNSGGTLPPNFLPLFALTGKNLANALNQLSGEAATGAQYGAFQLGNRFLSLMLDPFASGRNGGFGGGPFNAGGALSLAAERSPLPPEIALAYAKVLKEPPAPAYILPDRRWSVWGGGFGGSNRTKGDPAGVGSHDITTRTGGYAAGMDYRMTPDTVLGFALGGGFTKWGLADGLGGGKSDAFQAGLYGITRHGPAYLAGAANFTEYWMKTDRTAFAGNHLQASFDARSFGGRIEGGYRLATWLAGVTPYAALQAQRFQAPGYSETDVNGGGFALSYNGRNASATRSELGARFDWRMPVSDIALLTLNGRAAWAHDWVSDPTLTPVFQTLPGASFVVNGAAPIADLVLASAGAEMRFLNGWSLGARFDGEFAERSRTFAGTATLRRAW